MAVGTGLVLAVGGLAAASIAALALVTLASTAGLSIDSSTTPALLLSTLATDVGLVAVGGVYLSYRGLGTEYVKARKPTKEDLKIATVGFVVLLAVLRAASLAVRWLGIEVADNSVGLVVQNNPEAALAMVVASFLLVAPGEEFLFRGVIQTRMSEDFEPAWAIVVTAVVFASAHYLTLVGSSGGKAANIAILSLLALVFGAAYERADSIAAPILMHGAYNSMLFLAMYATSV